MCEFGFFSHFLRERSFKSRQNPRVDFFTGKKRQKDSKRRISIYCCWVLWSMDRLQLQFIRLEEAVSWTQRFLTRKSWPKNEVYLWQTNLKANVYRNSTFQVNTRKNATWDGVLPRGTESPFLSALHAKNDKTNLSGYKLGESKENNKALLFFVGKETIHTFRGSIQVITLLFAKW